MTTKNKEKEHYIHPKHTREKDKLLKLTEQSTLYTLICYTDIQPSARRWPFYNSSGSRMGRLWPVAKLYCLETEAHV